VRLKFVGLGETGVVVRGRGPGELTIPYEEILTAERLRSRRGLDLHTRGSIEPVRVNCRRADREEVESGLRFLGVRIVDCWGAIIAPTLLDFEEELAREPVRMRQSSDNA
jgi:hypothetical protein